MTFNRSLIIACFAALLAIPASAAERQTLTFRGGAPIEATALTDFLFPEAQCENATYQCLSVRPTIDRSVGVEVRFPTASAELTPAARSQLDPIGKVLAARNGKLNPGEIVIEGHTDARGGAELNRKLSEQRAKAVVEHLISAYKVEPNSLQAVGRGKDQLREGSRPDSEVNRRVELVRKAN
jgi:outer membrane protein OmpA-like peptidoglycan-associated protein